jgi:hypothetical protein
MDALQGEHHGAQNSSKTTLSLYLERLTVFPAKSFKLKSGAISLILAVVFALAALELQEKRTRNDRRQGNRQKKYFKHTPVNAIVIS